MCMLALKLFIFATIQKTWEIKYPVWDAEEDLPWKSKYNIVFGDIMEKLERKIK